MKLNLKIEDLYICLEKQLSNFFIVNQTSKEILKNSIKGVLDEVEKCFLKRNNKYYLIDKEACFSNTNADQYTVFLYYFSRRMYKLFLNSKIEKYKELAEQLYYLNKIMHGVNLFYGIDLPEHFACEHPIGSVLGRAEYGDYLTIYQGVTIGGNFNSNGSIVYPKLKNNIICFANSSIIGKCNIGSNVIIG